VRRPEKLSALQARRIALGAQGLARVRPEAAAGRQQVVRTVGRLGLLQMDSVSVLIRAHYLPLFSRLGPYPPPLLDDLAYRGRQRRLFEYWGHEASLLPVELQPLLRWRMARAERGRDIYGGLARFGRERAGFIRGVLAEIAARGPLRAAELAGGGPGQGSWWGWSDGKRALEWLFWAGLVTTATRRGFERVYDLPERVLPHAVIETPTPPEADAQRALLGIAARALGVATERDLRDYFRMEVIDTRVRIAELVEAGQLLPALVQGWRQPALLDPGARLPRRGAARALLSPFDNLLFERVRTERLFGFRYRLEIYTPESRRVHGYYVLPFLLGDRLVARVDLKADRANGCLRLLAAHCEAHAEPAVVAPALLDELHRMAAWLGLERVAIGERGDLAIACGRMAAVA
jgi:uncharacterized protein YcaQ